LAGIASIQTVQSRENGALLEQVAAIDGYRVLSQTVGNSGACNALFNPANIISPANPTFDGTTVTSTAPYVITVAGIPGIGTASPIFTQNSLPSPMTNSLFVPNNGIQIQVVSPTMANVVVAFDQTAVGPAHSQFECADQSHYARASHELANYRMRGWRGSAKNLHSDGLHRFAVCSV
jgi:hypothetical protein